MQELCCPFFHIAASLCPTMAGPDADVTLGIQTSSPDPEPGCRCGTMSGGGAGSALASASRSWTGRSSAMGVRPPQVQASWPGSHPPARPALRLEVGHACCLCSTLRTLSTNLPWLDKTTASHLHPWSCFCKPVCFEHACHSPMYVVLQDQELQQGTSRARRGSHRLTAPRLESWVPSARQRRTWQAQPPTGRFRVCVWRLGRVCQRGR